MVIFIFWLEKLSVVSLRKHFLKRCELMSRKQNLFLKQKGKILNKIAFGIDV